MVEESALIARQRLLNILTDPHVVTLLRTMLQQAASYATVHSN